MRNFAFAILLLAAGSFAAPGDAQEFCHTSSGQFANMRHCVTSVRTPQGGANFGPENLLATGDGAWCAAAEGPQSITLHLRPRALLRTVTMTNGHAKSAETFRQNGRVKRAEIETDGGYKALIFPQDSRAAQRFVIAKGRYAWVRLTVLESSRGIASPNVCLSEFLVNLEELGNK